MRRHVASTELARHGGQSGASVNPTVAADKCNVDGVTCDPVKISDSTNDGVNDAELSVLEIFLVEAVGSRRA